MIKVFVSIAIGLVIATGVVFVGPTISWYANGQNIVGDAEAAASYVAAAVAFLGTVFGASAAFVAYEWQRGDHHSTRRRTCAILVKTAIRPALQEMFELFELGIRAMSKEDRKRLITKELPEDYAPTPEYADEVKAFMVRWNSVSTDLTVDAETADALAHMEPECLELLLRAHAFWRKEAGTDGEEHFSVIIEWVEMSLDATLQLNTKLNRVLFGKKANFPTAKSTEAWLEQDNVPLPM